VPAGRTSSGEYGEELQAKIVEAGVAKPEELYGCSPEEIHDLQVRTGVVLPKAYRGFLEVMGRGAGAFFQGTDIYYQSLPISRDEVQEMMDEDEGASGFKLPDNAFVFASHQGYSFLFLVAEEGVDDPPVWVYEEGEGEPREVADSFTKWFAAAVRDHKELEE
jgi:hypothetical protein